MTAIRMASLALAGLVAWASPADIGFVRAVDAQAPSPSAAARHVDRSQLMHDVEILAARDLEGRRTGTSGGAKARQWIIEQFEAIGLAPLTSAGYVHPFVVVMRDVGALWPGGRPFRSRFDAANVIGRVPGRDLRAKTIVVTAHYDHLGIHNGSLHPGADDNASGVAVMLAAARHFRRHPPRHPFVFAALDAEEMGLRGAKALLASRLLPPATIGLNVNLDMVARSVTNEIFAAGTSYSPWERTLLEKVQTHASVTIRFGHDRPPHGAENQEDWTQSSDHGPFHRMGVPFVYFGVEDHPDYHKPTDTAQRIDLRFFGDAADMIVEALLTFDADLE